MGAGYTVEYIRQWAKSGSPWWVSLVAQMVKNLPAMLETWVRSLSLEYPLEKETATHSSVLAWEIPWTKRPDGLQPMGSQRVGQKKIKMCI